MSAREREALARHLGMSVEQFEREHTRLDRDDTVLLDRGTEGDCEWLERRADGTTGCRVNPAKPDQCRAYPFWPRVVASPAAWKREAGRCRGIGQGDVIPPAEIERRTGLEHALADLDTLFEELEHEVRALGARCWLSGDCCDFSAAGHRLFTSEIEAVRFAQGVDLAGWDPASGLCPAWKDRRCTAREHRPLACRTYFCDPAFKDRVQDLTERYVTGLKGLHRKHDLVWDYRDFLVHLEAIRNVAKANDRYQTG